MLKSQWMEWSQNHTLLTYQGNSINSIVRQQNKGQLKDKCAWHMAFMPSPFMKAKYGYFTLKINAELISFLKTIFKKLPIFIWKKTQIDPLLLQARWSSFVELNSTNLQSTRSTRLVDASQT